MKSYTGSWVWTDSLERPRQRKVDMIILERTLNKQGENVWIGCIWLRIQTGGGLLWTRQWTFGFHTRRRISWLCEWLL